MALITTDHRCCFITSDFPPSIIVAAITISFIFGLYPFQKNIVLDFKIKRGWFQMKFD
jgi:hypothetical protein